MPEREYEVAMTVRVRAENERDAYLMAADLARLFEERVVVAEPYMVRVGLAEGFEEALRSETLNPGIDPYEYVVPAKDSVLHEHEWHRS